MICDVTSSSVHCSAKFPSLQALVCKFPCSPGFDPGHLLDLLLRCSEFLGHDVASEVFVLLVQLLGVRRLARTLLLFDMKFGFNFGLALQILLHQFFCFIWRRCSGAAAYSLCPSFHFSRFASVSAGNVVCAHPRVLCLCLKLSKPRLLNEFSSRHRLHRQLIHPCVEIFMCVVVNSRRCLLLLSNLFMVNVLELEILFNVELLDRSLLDGCAAVILRTSHCTFDLGNFRILNCTYSRVLSFPSVILHFLRGIFFPERRHLVEFTSRIVCHFFRHLVSLACLRT